MAKTKKAAAKPGGKSAGGSVRVRRAHAAMQDEQKLVLVERLLGQVARELRKQKPKPSIADFIRLLELQKELARSRPRAIEVMWVEPKAESSH